MSEQIIQPNGAQIKAPPDTSAFYRASSNGHANGNGAHPAAPPIPSYSVGEYSVIRCAIADPAFAKETIKKAEAKDFPSPLANIITAIREIVADNITPDVGCIEEYLRCQLDKATDAAARADLRESQRVVAALQLEEFRPEVAAHARDFLAEKAAEFVKNLNPDEIIKPDDFVFEFSTDEKLDDCFTGIEWEWPGYIPRGFITAIVAEQEAGKSTVAQSLCDVKLRGTRWPDGQPHTPHPDTKLLWIDTEGTISLFHDRMKQWEMPRGRFIFPPDPLQELTIDDARTWLWIETATEKFKPPIIVIDALSGAHNSKSNDEDGMKPVMKRLSGLAQRHNIAIVVIHHLSKPAPGMKAYPVTIHRLRGSTAISQYCRSIIALGAPDESRPESKRLDVIKLNLAKKPPAVGYELTDHGPAWGEAPEPPKERRAVDGATDFLSVALANGPRESKELEEEAKQAGIGRNALFDAKKILKVKAQREGGKEGRWFWHPAADATAETAAEEEGEA